MKPLVKICNTGKCSIVITDLTQDSEEYVTESILDAEAYYERNKFKYSETCTINIIQRNTATSEEILDTIITDHTSYLDEAHYQLQRDGFYTIHHFIIPTVDWLEQELKKEHSILEKGIELYVCDCNSVYRYCDGTLTEVSPEVLSEINTENTTISRISINQFSICYLYDCYISLCRQIFERINYRCMNKSNLDEIKFKRDFLWMTINIIKYYVELNQLLEAQRLLEEVNFCGGLCNEQGIVKQQSSGCGCNR